MKLMSPTGAHVFAYGTGDRVPASWFLGYLWILPRTVVAMGTPDPRPRPSGARKANKRLKRKPKGCPRRAVRARNGRNLARFLSSKRQTKPTLGAIEAEEIG